MYPAEDSVITFTPSVLDEEPWSSLWNLLKKHCPPNELPIANLKILPISDMPELDKLQSQSRLHRPHKPPIVLEVTVDTKGKGSG